jgi:hypothetical protein
MLNKTSILSQKIVHPNYQPLISLQYVPNNRLFNLWAQSKINFSNPLKHFTPYFFCSPTNTNTVVKKTQDYEKQEELICSVVDQLFNENNNHSIRTFIPKLLNCNAIFEHHPELENLLKKQEANPNMWTFVNDINAIPEEKLPKKIAEVRTTLQNKITALTWWEKSLFVVSINNKFTKKNL